jgi:hypothetical protein
MAFWTAVATLALYFPAQIILEGNLTNWTREIKLVLLLVAAALISMPLAQSPADAWAEFNSAFIKAVLMFIVIVNVVRTERRLWLMMWLALAVGCFLSARAIMDFHAGRLLIVGTRVAGAISGGMFGNPNDMALHLVTMLPVAIALFFTRRNPLSKLAYAACAALLVGGVVVSFSRGGFLGLLAAGAVLAWKLGQRHKLAIAVCVMFAAVGVLALAPGDYASRLGTIANTSADKTGSASARRDLLLRSILVTARHPLLGVGIGNFRFVSIHDAPSHNAYTQVASEMGLYAMAIYIWFIVVPLRALRRVERETYDARRGSRYYYLAVGLQAAIVGYMVSSFFGSVAYQFYIYYLVGYAVALRRLYEAERAAQTLRDGATTIDQLTDDPLTDGATTGRDASHDYSESYA